MKRFQVLVGDQTILIREMPGEVKLSRAWPEDGEKKLLKMVMEHFNCAARAVYDCGTMGYIQTDLPDDYEVCGTCECDHAYEGADAKKHEARA